MPEQEELPIDLEEREEILEINNPLFYIREKTSIGWLTKLALETGDWRFKATRKEGDLFDLTNDNGVSFVAELKEGNGKNKGTYSIKGCVKDISPSPKQFHSGVNLHGVGEKGWTLRKAQLGAVHGLLSHWSLSNDTATVVLPTGTGKTETMLVTTIIDKAERTLVIVPTIDLKDQLADKFITWGILRDLGVTTEDTPYPTVLVLNKTLRDVSDIETIERANVVVSTPTLISKASPEVLGAIKNSFSHIYFDEAHHVKAAQWDSLKKLFRKSKIVQFTATPYRNDRQPIEGNVIYNYPLSQAIEDECFSNISLVTVDERHPRKKDQAIADAAMLRLKEDRENGFYRHKMMVRAENQSDAKRLFDSYSSWFPDERIVLVHSKVNGKKQIIEEIKSGHYDIVVCVDMLKEGFDYPDFKIAAVHTIHKSLSVLLQFIGRFARTQEGLGDASFVVNYAEESISVELENLFQEGSGWEQVISEIADAKKEEAETLLTFLQGCQPYSGFDSPDITLNPRLVYPALSCLCYRCEQIEWGNFKEAFNLKMYALSQPYFHTKENVFYFTTQKREKVKWARTKEMKDQTWNLIVMHYDTNSKLLFVGSSEKRLDVNHLVEKLSGSTARPLIGDCVFRSFDAIKRLSIVHAGIFKPANHLHRYSRLSGSDVTTELTRWKDGGRCDKSDFVGVGFRDGFPVSIGASVKGKIWSPSKVGDLMEWKHWCLAIGAMVTDENIDSNLLLEDSAKKVELEGEYPDVAVLGVDWSESLYDRIHKITIEQTGKPSFLLAETSLKFVNFEGGQANFTLHIVDDIIPFSIVLGGDKGHMVEGLSGLNINIEGLKANALPLEQFFQENPPTIFLLNGCTISGCVHTDYGECDIQDIPEDRIETLAWDDVDFTKESHYKSGEARENSIQEYMMRRLIDSGAQIVFNDDNSGESADIVAISMQDELIKFEMVHCKYSKETAGSRLSDLYEVCGQAIVSLRYKWKPEELLKHLERRNVSGVLKDKRFYHGSPEILDQIKKALKYTEVQFEFAIAQPGVDASSLNSDMKRLLGSVYSTIVEMTETKLRCYFS